MHDQLASVVALARTLLMSVDPAKESVTLNAASARLVLETFIELGHHAGSPLREARPSLTAQGVADSARRTVAGHIASVDLELNPPTHGWQRRGE